MDTKESSYKVEGTWVDSRPNGQYINSSRTDIINPSIRELVYKKFTSEGVIEEIDRRTVVSYVVDFVPGRFYYDAMIDDTIENVMKDLDVSSSGQGILNRFPYCPATGQGLDRTTLIRNVVKTNGFHLIQLIK